MKEGKDRREAMELVEERKRRKDKGGEERREAMGRKERKGKERKRGKEKDEMDEMNGKERRAEGNKLSKK